MDFHKIQNFIWDFDGTLFDTYPQTIDSFMAALAAFGVRAEREEVYTLMMRSIPAAFGEFENRYSLEGKLRAEYKKHFKTDIRSQGAPFPFALPVLKRVLSLGKRNFMFTHRVEDVYEFLEYHDFTKYFTDIVTLADKFAPKPSPAAVDYLKEKYHFSGEEAVMAGDREIDILSGRGAGILTLHITNNLPYKEFPADFRAGSLEEIYDLLGKEICGCSR